MFFKALFQNWYIITSAHIPLDKVISSNPTSVGQRDILSLVEGQQNYVAKGEDKRSKNF